MFAAAAGHSPSVELAEALHVVFEVAGWIAGRSLSARFETAFHTIALASFVLVALKFFWSSIPRIARSVKFLADLLLTAYTHINEFADAFAAWMSGLLVALLNKLSAWLRKLAKYIDQRRRNHSGRR